MTFHGENSTAMLSNSLRPTSKRPSIGDPTITTASHVVFSSNGGVSLSRFDFFGAVVGGVSIQVCRRSNLPSKIVLLFQQLLERQQQLERQKPMVWELHQIKVFWAQDYGIR